MSSEWTPDGIGYIAPDEMIVTSTTSDYVDFTQLRAGAMYAFTTADWQPKSGEVVPGVTVERVYVRRMVSEGATYLQVAPLSGGRELIRCDTVEAIRRVGLSVVRR